MPKQITNTNFFRYGSLFAGIGILFSGIFFQKLGAYDPWIFRTLLFISAITVALASIWSDFVKERLEYFVLFWVFPSGLWTIWLLYKNNLSGDYATSVIMSLIITSSMPWKNIKIIMTYLVITGFVGIVASILVINPELNRGIFMAIFALSVFLSVYFSYSRYQVQSRLTKSEELLRAIFDETVDSLFLVDLSNLIILECNASAIKMFGFTDKKEIIGSRMVEKLSLTEAAIERVKNGQVYHAQKFYQTKSGGFWGNIVIHTLSLASKDRALVRITDISPLMGVEQELASKVKELEEKNLSKM